ncbi:MAG: hypothetical protein Tsb009_01120 [Planctomycetaceae bacterium]
MSIVASTLDLEFPPDVEEFSEFQEDFPVKNNPPKATSSRDQLWRLRLKKLSEQCIEYHDSPQFQRNNAEQLIFASPHESEKSETGLRPPRSAPAFIAALYEFPLLSQNEEHHLFRKMNYLKYRANQLRQELNVGSVEHAKADQIEAWLNEAEKIRNEIVQANLRLVVSIAKKLVDAANSFDDLVSHGIPPLIRAVEIFDFDRGTRFSTYATWAVRNALHRATPRNRKMRVRYRTGVDAAFDVVPDTKSSMLADVSHRQTIVKSIQQGLEILDERDRKIVKARFALDGSERPLRFREIAEQLDISTERVRQLLERSLGRLRETLDIDLLHAVV